MEERADVGKTKRMVKTNQITANMIQRKSKQNTNTCTITFLTLSWFIFIITVK